MDWAQHLDMLPTIWMAMSVDEADETSDEESDIETRESLVSTTPRPRPDHAPTTAELKV